MVRIGFLAAVFAGILAGAAAEDTVFRDKIEPILKSNCAGCHSGRQAQAGHGKFVLNGRVTGGSNFESSASSRRRVAS